MTAEQAIKELKESHDIMRSYDVDESESRLMIALDMAIKALQAQADGEYILKSEAIRVASGYCHPSNIAKELEKLPSVAIPPEHDGCKDCRWQSQSETEMPCKQCKHNYTDEWERAKIGHWIWQTEDIYQCSECGEDIHVKEVMNKPQYAWCPICGSPMEIER